MKKIKNIFLILATGVSFVLLLKNPKAVSFGAVKGLMMCGEIIIPSLFIFSVIGIFVVSSNCTKILTAFISPFTKLFFGLNGEAFIVFLVSLFSGYPVGAKLINDMVENKKLNGKDANKMLAYCINAGPGFIILAIGEKIFHSKTLGHVLFASHLISSLILALFLRGKKEKESPQNVANVSLSDSFVTSVNAAAQSMINICAFVILFSVLFEIFSQYNLKFFLPFFEVTNGIILTKNLFFASFLLGFGGISVQLQIFSLVKSFKIDKMKFLIFRIIHGVTSSATTFLIIKALKISVTTLTNNQQFSWSPTKLTLSASFCFLISGVVFISSIKNPQLKKVEV